MANKYMTVKELIEELGTGRDATYNLVRSKTFPSIKIGKKYYIDREEFDKWRKRNLYSEIILK